MFVLYPDQVPSADTPIPWSELRSLVLAMSHHVAFRQVSKAETL